MMAFPTESDVALLEAALRAALTDGTWRVQTVQFSDQAVTLRSMKEATDLLATLRPLVVGSTRTRYAAHSKGV